MLRSRLFWVGLPTIALLSAVACVSGSLDDGGGPDVVLQVLGISNPGVTGEADLGTCSVSTSIQCLTNDNCPDTETCIPPVSGGDCTVTEWKVSMENIPKSTGATTSPFNDVTLTSVTITYTWLDGVTVTPPRTLPLGVTIPAQGAASVDFFPISFDDLTADNTTVNVSMLFVGSTGSGDSISVGAAAQLFIEDCIP